MTIQVEYKAGIDWRYLMIATSIFLITIVVSTAVWLSSFWYFKKHSDKYMQITGKNISISRKTRQLRYETALIKKYMSPFAKLKTTGIIDIENRLQWISSYRVHAKILKLKRASYRIFTQKKLGKWSLRYPGVGVYSSKMKIGMDLLHEMDLISMLDAFKLVQGFYNVTSCGITRVQPKVALNPAAINFRADCILEWYTLKPTRLARRKP